MQSLRRALAFPRLLAHPAAASHRRSLCSFKPPPALIPAEVMPLALRRRVASLEALHAHYERIEEEYQQRLAEMERSFQEESNALYLRRKVIVDGVEEPTDEEVNSSAYFAEFAEIEKDLAAADVQPEEPYDDPGGVPTFWPTVLHHSPALAPGAIQDFDVSEGDWAVLAYLSDVRLQPWEPEMPDGLADGFDLEDSSDAGFSIHFTFAPNPYLESEELAVFCVNSGEVVKVEAPTWRDGAVDPTIKVVTKKMRKRSGGPVQRKESVVPTSSFFRIFSVVEEEDEDQDMLPVQELQEEIVMRLREDTIPRAAIYYIQALHGYDVEQGGMEQGDEPWDVPPSGGQAR